MSDTATRRRSDLRLLEQHLRHRHIVEIAGCAEERRQWLLLIGLLNRCRRDAIADRLIRIRTGVQYQSHTATHASDECLDSPERRVRDGNERRNVENSSIPIHPLRIYGDRSTHGSIVADSACEIRIATCELGPLGEELRCGTGRPKKL